jgi:argininosuccinate synthase
MTGKVVLAYSGGLNTSIIIPWMKDKHACDVVTLTADVGQADDLTEVEKKSKLIGATKHYTIDSKQEFIEDYVLPAIKTNALYDGRYPISTTLARPLIAKKLVDIAHDEQTT